MIGVSNWSAIARSPASIVGDTGGVDDGVADPDDAAEDAVVRCCDLKIVSLGHNLCRLCC